MKDRVNKRIVRSQDTVVVDGDGVEVRKTVTSTVLKGTDVFYRTYVKHVALINKLPPSEFKFLHSLAAMVDWDTNEIAFTGVNNKKICEIADMTDATRRSCLSRLCKKGFLRKVSYLCYQLNPNIFFKGTDVERAKVLSVEYKWTVMEDKKKKGAIEPNQDFEI
jgi:hypothetical protein